MLVLEIVGLFVGGVIALSIMDWIKDQVTSWF